MTWEEFASRVRTHQIGFMGQPNESKPGKGEFHENPIACICEDSNSQSQNQSQSQRHNLSEENNNDFQANKSSKNESEIIVKEQLTREEEHNVSLAQQGIENQNGFQVDELPRRNKNNPDHCELVECHSTNP